MRTPGRSSMGNCTATASENSLVGIGAGPVVSAPADDPAPQKPPPDSPAASAGFSSGAGGA